MTRLERGSQPSINADLIPVRMCNELVYCPRLFYLEHVQGYFQHSSDTINGASQHAAREHRRSETHHSDDGVPIGDECELPPQAIKHSEILTSERWGVRGKLDYVKIQNSEIVAIEHKRGRGPLASMQEWEGFQLPYQAWSADIAQLGLYLAILQDAGYRCERGRIFYRSDRKTIEIQWSANLEEFLQAVVAKARDVARASRPPVPLVDSPKCARCSLVGICLPVEHNFLLQMQTLEQATAPEIRATESDIDLPSTSCPSTIPRLIPGTDEYATVHVVSPGSTIRKRGNNVVVVRRDGSQVKILGKDIGHLAIYGPSQVTQQCLLSLLTSGVSITHHSGTGRLLGVTTPLLTKNIAIRRAQFRSADCSVKTLEIAKQIVCAKIKNQRTLLRRYRASKSLGVSEDHVEWIDGIKVDVDEVDQRRLRISEAMSHLTSSYRNAGKTDNLDALRGHEGDAAARYFGAVPELLPASWKNEFTRRTRRPPRDRVNALLSFGYAMLMKDAINSLVGVGLDPMLGFLHRMIAGRPSLALDLMEPFRAAWVDVAYFRLISTNGIRLSDFHESNLGVFLKERGKRAAISAYERRADEETTHPRFGYRMSLRRILALDARLMAKFISEEVEVFAPFTTR